MLLQDANPTPSFGGFGVNGVEIQTRYKDFERPEGLEIERVAPLSA